MARILEALDAKVSLIVRFNENPAIIDTSSLAETALEIKQPVLSQPVGPVEIPEKSRMIKLSVHVSARDKMTCPLGNPLLARENIEREILGEFSMKRGAVQQSAWLSIGEYELTFWDTDEARLQRQIMKMIAGCEQEAGKLKCLAKCEIRS